MDSSSVAPGPPQSLSQRPYGHFFDTVPRSESFATEAIRDTRDVRSDNKSNLSPDDLQQPPAFFVSPKTPVRQETFSTISESPQDSIIIFSPDEKPLSFPKAPQSAIVSTTSIMQSYSQRSSPEIPVSSAMQRQDSVPVAHQTTYMKMLLGLDKISKLDNILIAFFNWIILAGFLIFPATYVSLESASKSPTILNNAAARTAIAAIQHVLLLVMAYSCCAIGCAGILWLWWKLRMNYVWLCNKIFFTVCLNSLAGLISTLISVYGQKGGYWSLQAKITAAVTGGVCGIAGGLYLLYNFAFLSVVKRRHESDMAKLNELDI